jgi:hypothetical protein
MPIESVHSRNPRVADESSALLQLNRHVTTVRRRIARAFPSLRTGDVSVQSRAASGHQLEAPVAHSAIITRCHTNDSLLAPALNKIVVQV